MADIRETIINKYGFDIDDENIINLYKIDSANISMNELAEKIQKAHETWDKSINGANEKIAERARKRLDKADKYEAVLKDDKLRTELFNYYNKSSDSSVDSKVEFAREYFKLLETSVSKIKKSDVDFFFKYFDSERKYKKEIQEMLKKEFKIHGLDRESKFEKNDEEEIEEESEKNNSKKLIVNLFQENTIFKINKVIKNYEKILNDEMLCREFPEIRNGLYEFIEIDDKKKIEDFKDDMSQKSKMIYDIRQEKGSTYNSLVDLYNGLKDLCEHKDVIDNFQQFKLLLRYPKFTPYMFSFVNVKKDTMEGMVKIAKREYSFRDSTDFILSYYKPIFQNFNIDSSAIKSMLREADKKAAKNMILNAIDEKLGMAKSSKGVPIGVKIIHGFVYWPVFLAYFIFEIIKNVFLKLHLLAIPIFAAVFSLEAAYFNVKYINDNHIIGKDYNYLDLTRLFGKGQWSLLMSENAEGGFQTLMYALIVIGVLVVVYFIPPFFASVFCLRFADDFNKNFDWIGIERTFKEILRTLKEKTSEQYERQKDKFIKKKITNILINILCVAIVIALIIFIPQLWSLASGYL